MSILAWIVLGALAGWIASIITGTYQGWVGNVIVGIIGAFIGGLLLQFFGAAGATGLNVPSLLTAILGAVILLALTKGFNRSRV